MKKLNFTELASLFREHNLKKGVNQQFSDDNALIGVVVFKDEGVNKGYSLESRSYKFRSDNKYFVGGQIGNSIFTENLDRTDDIRLDWYLGDKDWKIDYCYLATQE